MKKKLQDMLDARKKKALLATKLKDKKSRLYWKDMYDLKDQFLDYKYKYACTLHKLQGSTVDTIFLDFRDLPWNDNDLKYRLMYVGLTRASEGVNILL